MKRSGYQIEDEPRPGPLSHLTVKPVWPFLAVMLAGGWLAIPWFVFNGFAIGSATRVRELVTALAGLAGAAAVWIAATHFIPSGSDAPPYLKYVFLLVPFCKLLAAYHLHDMQTRSFELYDHFGGSYRNGMGALIAGAILRSYVLGAMPSLTLKIIAS